MPTPPHFARFRDLDAEAIRIDWQVHTTQTDGEADVETLLREARRLGLRSLAITEHVRRNTDWFAGFAAGVREAALGFPELEVLVGCEAKALDAEGGFDASEETLAMCDLVLGSVHRFPDGRGGYVRFEDLSPEDLAEQECRLAEGLAKRAPIHVLSHPGGMYQRRHGAYPRDLHRRMLEACAARGIAIEINASYLVEVRSFLDLCREINPFVSMGSDVHKLEDLGRCWRMLQESGIGQP